MSGNEPYPPNNGAVHIVAQIIKVVMLPAAESEIGAMYINTRETVLARQTLFESGHPQPPTSMQTDNSAAHLVAINKVQLRQTKAMGMRFQWLRCREAQNQF